jgi:hypothetical protein
MTTRYETPASRLICVGDAKQSTQASVGNTDELDNGGRFD